uniref:Peptidase A1 domain-containing protein n=1 Tax=Ananas comosus var. bracteatus TaxID=296719 RepID=A0A6V7P776_ANACO|nr:unnamed protein product [Ananas comosus var. bracteatus]
MYEALQIIPPLLLLSSSIVCSLHLNLIHKHSIHSPLFPGNLTAGERQLRLQADDEARTRLLETSLQSGLNYSEENLRPYLAAEKFVYMVEVSIGTPTHDEGRRKYYLVLDTGSGIVWLQCEPCINCWNQITPIFDPSKDSTTFAPIPCNHPLCDLRQSTFKCVNNQCRYNIRYMTPATSKGVLASETLGFASSAGSARTEFVRHFILGCARDNRQFSLPARVAGVFGLNMEPPSPASQMEGRIGGRFAYCLPRFTGHAQPPSRLKFGDEAILRDPHVKTLRFVHVHGKFRYYLPLIDVSIADRRIGFAPGAFAVHRRGQTTRGGFIIDTGTTYTRFITGGPYKQIMEAFKEYFKPFKLRKAKSTAPGSLKLCYKIPRTGFTAFPSMTLHFSEGNDFVIQPPNVVVQAEEKFCIAVGSLNVVSILGSYQQHDYKISYDVRNKLLSYASADCSRVV